MNVAQSLRALFLWEFDLVEAESELVAGFMVEYSSTPYMLYMLGEYVSCVTMCALATLLFLGGLVAAGGRGAAQLGAGYRLVRRQMRFHLFPLCHGQGHGAAVSLRPVDAAWVEGVPPALFIHGCGRSSRASVCPWGVLRDRPLSPMARP